MPVPKAPWSAAARRRLRFKVNAAMLVGGTPFIRLLVGMDLKTARRRRAAALQGGYGAPAGRLCLACWSVWISRLQGGVEPPHSKALRASGLVNQRDQLEVFQGIILRALAVSLVVAQGGQGILFGIGEAASVGKGTGDVELCLSGTVDTALRFLVPNALPIVRQCAVQVTRVTINVAELVGPARSWQRQSARQRSAEGSPLPQRQFPLDTGR